MRIRSENVHPLLSYILIPDEEKKEKKKNIKVTRFSALTLELLRK